MFIYIYSRTCVDLFMIHSHCCWFITQEAVSPTNAGRSVIDIHHKNNFHVIPQNKLGQDIFIRATEIRGLQNIIKMPPGAMKPLRVPVSKNMLDAHLKGNLFKKLRTMVTIIIAGAEVCFSPLYFDYNFILTSLYRWCQKPVIFLPTLFFNLY